MKLENESSESHETTRHTGQLIKNQMEKSPLKVSHLASIMGYKREQTINDNYGKSNMNTGKFTRFCLALDSNLFETFVAKQFRDDENDVLISKFIDLSLITNEFSIGKIIKFHLDGTGKTRKTMAETLPLTERGIEKVCEKKTINTELLARISKYVNFNLFLYLFVYVRNLLREKNLNSWTF